MPMFGMSRRVARRTARRTTRRQMAMYESQNQGGYEDDGYDDEPQAAAAPEKDYTEELAQLAQLHEQGVLTDEEFAAKKKEILGI
jgi:hypothetical protein